MSRMCYVRVSEGPNEAATLSAKRYRAERIDADFAVHPALCGDADMLRLTHIPTGRWAGHWPSKAKARAFVRYLRSRRKDWSLTNPLEAIPKRTRAQMAAKVEKMGGRWA